MSLRDTPASVAIVETETSAAGGDHSSYVDWAAILGGAVFATAITVVFLAFGAALGLSMTSLQEGEGTSGWGISIAAGLWFLFIQISAFMAGAYVTGRMRRRMHDASEDESDFRDGAHGLLVWGVGVLIGAMIAASAASGVATTAASAVSSVASGAASAVGGIASGVGNAADNPVISSYVDRLFRRAPNTEAGQAVQEAAREISPEQRSEVGRILASSVVNGEFNEDDRNYVASVVAPAAGVTPEEARARIDQVATQAEETAQAARDAADAARRAALVVAFLTAASLAVSAAAAYFAATLGGRHRDDGVALEWARFPR